MKKIAIISSICLLSCAQNTQTHPPVGGFLSEKDLTNSRNRAKNLNATERSQIEDWIKKQKEPYYPMSLNYWVNVPDLQNNPKKNDGEEISYQYDIYDFDGVKLYNQPKTRLNVKFGHFEEIKSVEDCLKYLKKDEEATLLVPSVLAFGTYGDNLKISNDMPLIIKLKVL